MSNFRGFWGSYKWGATSNCSRFWPIFRISATGDMWSFSGLFVFVNRSRSGEGWLDVACRAMQAGYWTNRGTLKWRTFDFKVSSHWIMNPGYKATIAMFDSFVSDNMWFGWSMCPSSGNVFPFRYR